MFRGKRKETPMKTQPINLEVGDLVIQTNPGTGGIIIYGHEGLKEREVRITPYGDMDNTLQSDFIQQRRLNGNPEFVALFINVSPGKYLAVLSPKSYNPITDEVEVINVFAGTVTEVDWRDVQRG